MVNIENYISGLNKTLRGKDGYFFLVHDSNNELKQHYDPNYESSMDYDLFRKSQKSKEDYFESKGIAYGFFVIPDKSVILREYLPFDTEEPIRHVDRLSDCVYDTLFLCDESDCQRCDTHLAPLSSIKLVSYFLSVIHGKFREYYEKLLRDKTHVEIEHETGDLLFLQNWSEQYGDKLRNKCIYGDVEVLKCNDTCNLVRLDNIPKEFRKVRKRESIYYINPNSITDKKAVIFRGSSVDSMIPVFNCYYREVFFYWDYAYFNKELVDWFEPDDVLDIRRERFLDRPSYPTLTDPKTLHFPTVLNVNLCGVEGGVLKLDFVVKNLANVVIPFRYEVRLNDDLVFSNSSCTGVSLEYPLAGKYQGFVNVGVYAKEDGLKTDYEFEKRFSKEVYSPVVDMDGYFGSLNGMLIGKDLTFFVVNDKNNELRQHYDSSYDFNFDENEYNEFIQSKDSFLNELGAGYGMFVIPDRSVVLSDKLPFEVEPKRLVDKIDGIHDLYSILGEDDYYLNDTTLKDKSSLFVVSFILSVVTNMPAGYWDGCFKDYVSFKTEEIKGNLCTSSTWSYGKDLIYKQNSHVQKDAMSLGNFFENAAMDGVPREFRTFNGNDALHFRNENSFSDKKLLVFCDSLIVDSLALFALAFREVLIYNTGGIFLKDAVEWYKPDNVVEVYREALLDKSILADSKTLDLPKKVNVNLCDVEGGVLKLDFVASNLADVVIPFRYEVRLNDDLVFSGSSCTGVSLEYPLVGKYQGFVNVDVYIVDDDLKAGHGFEKRFSKEVCSPVLDMDAYLGNLKGMVIGKDLNFFVANDKNNELRQHYDSSFKSHFNIDSFKKFTQSKLDYLSKLDIGYGMFAVPDKSVVLSDKLPFETEPMRIVDKMEGINDLYSILDEDSYCANDTHLNGKSSLDVVSYILSKVADGSFDYWEHYINNYVSFENKEIKGNLCFDSAWSYGKDLIFKHNARLQQEKAILKDFFEKKDITTYIPGEFRTFDNKDALYYENEIAAEKKLLVFCDSSLVDFLPLLTLEFGEVLIYRTNGYFLKDVVEWYKPDNVVEVYGEVFFDSINSKLERMG